jgi:NADPH-dependent 2,4-dienoyl-CoA reductase/sulfur reductase-like enzyme
LPSLSDAAATMRRVPGRILIAGGGLAAQRSAETLRARGHDGPIAMVCAETVRPYDRPPLSKEYLAEDAAQAPFFRPEQWYAENDVELVLGRRATAADARHRRLKLDDGSELPYDDLIVATGTRPRRLPHLPEALSLSTLGDADRLRAKLVPGAHLVIAGAGFIGLEVAATARGRGADVTIVEPAGAPLSRVLPGRLGAFFADLHRSNGVRLELGTTIEAATGSGVRLSDGRLLPADALLVAIGVSPVPGLGVAGLAGEHWEPAARAGAGAAREILGLPPLADMPHSLWSDQYGTRFQLVGESGDAVEIDGDLGARDFTAVLLRRGMPVGALLAGRPTELPAWRRRLADRIPERTAA